MKFCYKKYFRQKTPEGLPFTFILGPSIIKQFFVTKVVDKRNNATN
jgi:hypothetical protein